MRPIFVAEMAAPIALISLLVTFSVPSASQAPPSPATTASVPDAPKLKCTDAGITPSDPSNNQKDPFVGELANSGLPAGLLPINDATRQSILGSGLPCQEQVSTGRAGKDRAR